MIPGSKNIFSEKDVPRDLMNIQKESELADLDDEEVQEKPKDIIKQRKQDLASIETLEDNSKDLDKVDLNNHKTHALEPKKHETAIDPEPQEEGEKWFDKANVQTKDVERRTATINQAPWTIKIEATKDQAITAPAGGTTPSTRAVPIEDSPVIEDLEPQAKVEEKHDRIYDNFPKGKLCKDNCPEKKEESVAAPDYSSTLSEGTSS